ncbi:hypothetical protein GCM10010232_71000 [Streptomyces amakusaensis]|uniref:Uncharacterized protein n=1 Tax=Streptomyces amakusaensis TaxID=67271 RepID=A0ABW0ATP5_9ACTN
MDLADLDTDPASAVLAHAELQTVEGALPDYRASALGRLSRTGEADAEARRAYKAEQGRRWYQHNPNGTDVVTAAAKAADTARTRTMQHLLTARLEQLREQTTTRTDQPGSAPWTGRCPNSPPTPGRRHGRGGGRVTPELSRVDLAHQAPGRRQGPGGQSPPWSAGSVPVRPPRTEAGIRI